MRPLCRNIANVGLKENLRFWSADAAHMQDQLTQFLKNFAILGGMLLVIERESAAVDPLRIIGRSVA